MPVLDNPRHEKFAQLVAKGGISDMRAYMQALDTNEDTASKNAWRLRDDEGISGRIRELQEKSAAKVEWSLTERLKYCADVAQTKIGEIDETSPLCQSAKYYDGGREFKMPDKLRAVELYTKLAGDGAPDELKVGVDDPTLDLLKLVRAGKA